MSRRSPRTEQKPEYALPPKLAEEVVLGNLTLEEAEGFAGNSQFAKPLKAGQVAEKEFNYWKLVSPDSTDAQIYEHMYPNVRDPQLGLEKNVIDKYPVLLSMNDEGNVVVLLLDPFRAPRARHYVDAYGKAGVGLRDSFPWLYSQYVSIVPAISAHSRAKKLENPGIAKGRTSATAETAQIKVVNPNTLTTQITYGGGLFSDALLNVGSSVKVNGQKVSFPQFVIDELADAGAKETDPTIRKKIQKVVKVLQANLDNNEFGLLVIDPNSDRNHRPIKVGGKTYLLSLFNNPDAFLNLTKNDFMTKEQAEERKKTSVSQRQAIENLRDEFKSKSGAKQMVTNPDTRRPIELGGETYLNLLKNLQNDMTKNPNANERAVAEKQYNDLMSYLNGKQRQIVEKILPTIALTARASPSGVESRRTPSERGRFSPAYKSPRPASTLDTTKRFVGGPQQSERRALDTNPIGRFSNQALRKLGYNATSHRVKPSPQLSRVVVPQEESEVSTRATRQVSLPTSPSGKFGTYVPTSKEGSAYESEGEAELYPGEEEEEAEEEEAEEEMPTRVTPTGRATAYRTRGAVPISRVSPQQGAKLPSPARSPSRSSGGPVVGQEEQQF